MVIFLLCGLSVGAAPAEPASAEREQGLDFRQGRKGVRDDAVAAAWFAEGCNAGDGLSCALLGEQYLYGLSVKAQPFAGAELVRRGCALGSKAACKTDKDLVEALTLCDEGRVGKCGLAQVYYEYGITGGEIDGKIRLFGGSLSYAAEAELVRPLCDEHGKKYHCRRAQQLREMIVDRSATPAWLSLDGVENTSLMFRHCVVSRDYHACDAFLGLGYGPTSPENEVASQAMCDMGFSSGCEMHRKWTSAGSGDGAKAFGALLSVAGQVAGSQAGALAEGGNMGAAYASVAAGAVLPQIGRQMQGGEDAAWVAGTAQALGELSAAVRAGSADPHARAMGGEVSLVRSVGPAPSGATQVPTPAAAPAGPLCVPPNVDQECQERLQGERDACDQIPRGIERTADGGVASARYAEYEACFGRWEAALAECHRVGLSAWHASNPQCVTGDSGPASTSER